MSPAGTIAVLRADMETAVLLYRHGNPLVRKPVDAVDERDAAFDSAKKCGVIEKIVNRYREAG